MRILGIDPALRITGFGIIDWDGRGFRIVTAGTVKTDDRQPLPRRLAKLHTALRSLADEFKPEILVLEKIYVHPAHPATAFILGHARGIVCLAAEEKGIPVAEYTATRVKKALTGKGLAQKTQVQRTVASLLGLSALPRYLDVTDALALAVAFCYLSRAQTLERSLVRDKS